MVKETCELAEAFGQMFDKEVVIKGGDEEMLSELNRLAGIRRLCFWGSEHLEVLFSEFGSFTHLQHLELVLQDYCFSGKECRKWEKKKLKLKYLESVRVEVVNSSGEARQFLVNLMCLVFQVKVLSICLDFEEEFVWLE